MSDIVHEHGIRVWRDTSTIEGLVRLRLTRPERRNAQTPDMWELLASASSWLSSDDKFLVIDAEGPDFSAGLDRSYFAPRDDGLSLPQIAAGGPDALQEFIAHAQRGFQAVRDLPILTIAAVQGNAIGAGFQLALACDLMVVTPDATLRLAEVQWGIIPDLGGATDLVASVGRARATQALVGLPLSGEQAHEWGLAVAVAPELESAIRHILESLAHVSPQALGHAARLSRSLVRSDSPLEVEQRLQLSLIFGQHRQP